MIEKENKDVSIKEKILNKLEGKLDVTKVERVDWEEGVYIHCEFMNEGKKGDFDYNLIGSEWGVENLDYNDEEDKYDIHDEINKWVEENIESSIVVKYKGENLV